MCKRPKIYFLRQPYAACCTGEIQVLYRLGQPEDLPAGVLCRKVVATTDCLLYKWDLDAVEKMASPACAALAAAGALLASSSRGLLLYAVGAAFSSTCDDVSAPCNLLAGRTMLAC